MTVRKFSDQGFDDFRKERKRMQAKIGPQGPAANDNYENRALRELEQAEAKEVREQQLTREVHDFFAAATKQAAAIVDRVSKDAQQVTGERVEQEMESFLIDSLARMNTLVMTIMQQRHGQVAETQLEPRIGNLVGTPLDEFRFAGTADIGDKHIGQDPFATAVDEVQREFRLQVGPTTSPDHSAVPIDQHLVAAVTEAVTGPAPTPKTGAMPSVPPTSRTTANVAPSATAVAQPAAAAATPATTEASANVHEELERFKGALKALVRQGVMTKEEARAAWQTRLQALGAKG